MAASKEAARKAAAALSAQVPLGSEVAAVGKRRKERDRGMKAGGVERVSGGRVRKRDEKQGFHHRTLGRGRSTILVTDPAVSRSSRCLSAESIAGR